MTPKCRILCPTFGGHINPSKSYGYFSVTNGSRPTGSPFVSLLYPISGALSIASRQPGGIFCTPEGPRDIIEQTPSSRRLAAVHRTGRAVPQGASISCKSPRRRSLKNSLGGDLLCLKSPAAAIGLAARSVSGHRRCLSGFPADALPFCAAVPGAPAVGDPVPAERH